MLEALLEVVFEFVGELLLQLLGELIGSVFKVTWFKLRHRDSELSAPAEALWSVITGLLAGIVTLALFPELALRQPWQRLLNLVLAPLAAGLLVERIRAWREGRRGFNGPGFAYAALFGFVFALTRYLFGQ